MRQLKARAIGNCTGRGRAPLCPWPSACADAWPQAPEVRLESLNLTHMGERRGVEPSIGKRVNWGGGRMLWQYIHTALEQAR